MAKVIKQYSDKEHINGIDGAEINLEVSLGLQATKNTHAYYIDYPIETFGKNPFIAKDDKIKKGHLVYVNEIFGTVAHGLKNAPKANVSKADVSKISSWFSDYNLPNVGVEKLFGKYYYWVYNYDGADNDTGDDFYHCCDLYPASDFKFVTNK